MKQISSMLNVGKQIETKNITKNVLMISLAYWNLVDYLTKIETLILTLLNNDCLDYFEVFNFAVFVFSLIISENNNNWINFPPFYLWVSRT
jgi:hypothetical protein